MPDAVEVLEWPSDADRRSELAAQGRPRLLIVRGDDRAPECEPTFEDWIRLPAPEEDLARRLASLGRHAAVVPDLPWIDEDNLLRRGESWVALSPLQAILLSVLLARPNQVTTRDRLLAAAWPEGELTRRALDTQLARLRPRVKGFGISVVAATGRGYVLTPETTERRRS